MTLVKLAECIVSNKHESRGFRVGDLLADAMPY